MEWYWIRRLCPRLPAGRHARTQHRDLRVSSPRAECPCLPPRRKKGKLGLDVSQRRACRGGNADPAAFRRKRGHDPGMSRLRMADSSHSVAGKRCASRQRHRCRIPRPHRGARPVLPIAREPARRVSMGLGVCHSLRRVPNNTPVCPETSRYGPPWCDTLLGSVVVLWHPPGRLELEIIATRGDRVHSSSAARFVARRHLSDNLYWVAVFRALLSGSTSASVDSRRSGILALYCATPAFSSTALGMGTNGRHRGGGR